MKICLEYIWIDGIENLRSKNKILNINSSIIEENNLSLEDIPLWNFDGSSTGQATGKESDIILKPIRIYSNPFITYIKSYLILCECFNKDLTPHVTNNRYNCTKTSEQYKDLECMFGIEQEYTLFERNKDNLSNEGCNLPYKWKEHNNPEIGGQNPYYCSIGGDRTFGRPIVEEHLKKCLEAGVEICGTNAEVMASQWEFQIGICDPLKVCDDLWIARYILQKITENYDCYATFHPKPYKGDWNGTGGHTNFSTKDMRSVDGIEHIYKACEKMKLTHSDHMKVYGKYNDQRMSGVHETSSIDNFTYGVGNRGCSVRIPIHVFIDKCGYLEDRRPASNLDPYLVTEILMRTVCN